MITTERLEELIKQGATIWRKRFTDKIFPLKLDERNSCISMPDMCLWVGSDCFDINTLFETKDRAEWALKTTAEHTERFEPPMWEDLQEDLEVIDYKFAFTINGNCNYLFWVAKDKRGSSIEIRKFNVYKVETILFYSDPATKENYIKACEIVRDLFNKGGAK